MNSQFVEYNNFKTPAKLIEMIMDVGAISRQGNHMLNSEYEPIVKPAAAVLLAQEP